MSKSRLKRPVLLLFLLAMMGIIALAAVGIQRYGSVRGVVQRIEVEIAARQPRPTALPTIIPLSTVDMAQISAMLEPTPTARPTETVPATHTPPADQTLFTVTSRPPVTATLRPSSTANPLFVAAAPAVYLEGYRHQWQGWNNCAPATLATYLSFWNGDLTQDAAAAGLKPNEKDKNVTPAEVAALSRSQGFEATWLVNGEPALLKTLVTNGFPVMVETWLEPEPGDGMGHYRLVVGYDESAAEWIVSDSYVSKNVASPYRGIRLSDSDFQQSWRLFLNTMIVIYPPDRALIAQAIIGEAAEPGVMWRHALEQTNTAAAAAPTDGIAWHNLGRALWALEQREQAVAAFDQARAAGLPWRMFWYQFDALEAYVWAGRPQDVLALTQASIDSGGGGEEVYFWKGMAHESLGQNAEADSAWRNALWWHPNHRPALDKLAGR